MEGNLMTDPENEAIGRRLRKALDGKLTIVRAAELARVTPKTLQRWLKGETSVDVGALQRICAEAGVSSVYILTGFSDESGDWETHLPAANIGEKRIPIRDVSASAGYGLEALGEAPRGWVTFPLDLLMRIGNPDMLDIISVEGDSMIPELHDGDLAMIDRSQINPADGLFVLLVDERLFLKRVVLRGRNKAELVSTNPAYPPFEVAIDTGDDDYHPDVARMIGRVVWVGRAL